MHAMSSLRQRELAMAVILAIAVTACGGGGGGSRGSYSSAPVVTPPAPPALPTPPTPSFDIQLTGTGAKQAHAAGLTGKGVVIGMADAGVSAANPALVGRVKGDAPGASTRGDAVAALAAGRAVGQFAGGIAPDASIVSVKMLPDGIPSDERNYRPFTFTSAAVFDSTNRTLAEAGAKIINYGFTDGLVPNTLGAEEIPYANAFRLAPVYDVLFVIGAGNLDQPRTNGLVGLPNVNMELSNHWLVAIALDGPATDRLAAYSNRCDAPYYTCIGAPGTVQVLAQGATADHPVYETRSGTSYAAAQVSGAAAVVSGLFPTLSMEAVQRILLSTADDLGESGRDPTYGYGRLNLAKAIRGPASLLDRPPMDVPTGTSTITFANDIGGGGVLKVSGAGQLSMLGDFPEGVIDVADTATVDVAKRLQGTTVGKNATMILRGDVGYLDSAGRPQGWIMNFGHLDLSRRTTAMTIGGGLQTIQGAVTSVRLGAPINLAGDLMLHGDLRIEGAVPGYVRKTHETLFTARQVSGQFDSMSLADGVFLHSYLQYSNTEVWMDTTFLTINAVATGTPSIAASAAAVNAAARTDAALGSLDAALSSTVPTMPSLATLKAAGGLQHASDETVARQSLESLSGQLYAAGTAMTLAGIDAGNDALMSHVAERHAGGAWAQSLGGQGAMNRSGFGNVSFNLGGQLVGQQLSLGGDAFAGIAVARLSTSSQLGGAFDRQRSRTTEGMFYAGTQGAHWYGVGRVGYGSFRGDMRRLLRFGEQGAFAGGAVDGDYTAGYGELGYRTQVGGLSLTPFANLQYATIRRDAFEEAGGNGFGLASGDHATSRWQAGVGLRIGSTWFTSRGRLRFDAKFAWQNAFATKGEVFAARYTGFSQWAPVEGIGLSRQAATAGLQLGWDVNERTQLAFGMDQRFANRDHSRSGTASVRVVW